jgi:hypothetical protein
MEVITNNNYSKILDSKYFMIKQNMQVQIREITKITKDSVGTILHFKILFTKGDGKNFANKHLYITTFINNMDSDYKYYLINENEIDEIIILEGL